MSESSPPTPPRGVAWPNPEEPEVTAFEQGELDRTLDDLEQVLADLRESLARAGEVLP